MGQKAEEMDGQTIAENLVENILNEVSRSITERTDSCFDSFESLKLQTFGSEDTVDYGCSRRENCGKPKECECQDNVNADFHGNDLCYPSLANLPEVCVHSSSMLKTSKQGEGDFQHPTIREAVAFYRLETDEENNRPSGSKAEAFYRLETGEEENRPSGSKAEAFYRLETGEEENRPSISKDCSNSCCGVLDSTRKSAEQFDTVQVKCSLETEEEGQLNESEDCKNSCASSFTTEISHDELIENLQRAINNVSFDSILLSDSEDGSEAPLSTASNSCARERDACDGVCLFEDDSKSQDDVDDCLENQTCLHQSQKFCQFNKVHFFPHNDFPPNYCQLVDESYARYEKIAKEEEEEEDDEQTLLSDGSSEELVIIEGDEIDHVAADQSRCFSQVNSCQAPFRCNVTPSTALLSQYPSCNPGTSRQSAEPSDNKITVAADVEPINDRRYWEEDLEVQVSVTEPMKMIELEDDDDNGRFVKVREYWTSAGLVTEKNVDPKYASFRTDDTDGIESVPGVSRVQETRFTHARQKEDEILKFDEVAAEKLTSGRLGKIQFEETSSEQDRERGRAHNDCTALEQADDEDKVNYLNLSAGTAKNSKKKNTLVSRLTKSFSNVFRLRKKNPK